MHASLLALHSKIDSLHASTAASGTGSPADDGSLLGIGPPPISPGTTLPPIPGQFALSLDIPSFIGIDSMCWIAKAEQYFDLNYTPKQNNVSTRLWLARMTLPSTGLGGFANLTRASPSPSSSRR
ncbi:hypothetical protein KSP39_PZI020878 [Platanthera zijinensis]|uniref:Uncharacterized protein n=1 Tax=Platanthera zijinensis TaxID=2320716 RepID=A0AAP0B094_9ASPA